MTGVGGGGKASNGNFFIVFGDYFVEVLPFLAIGFFLSGLIHEFVPACGGESTPERGQLRPGPGFPGGNAGYFNKRSPRQLRAARRNKDR